ncbi:MAG: AMIN domain-containing protein [Clostridia bacterium]|nr:MAG: AMIN domain-containing protein [Clostridia bacterium]
MVIDLFRRWERFWFVIAVVALVALTGHGAPARAEASVKLVVNRSPVEVDVNPYIDANGRTMVPVRFVAESLGAAVQWLETERQVTIAYTGRTIVLHIDDTRVRVDGRELALDTVPVIAGGRTMVPLRFVAETMGATVGWNEALRTVFVLTPEPPLADKPPAATPEPSYVVVTGSRVNIRSGPSQDYGVISQVARGDRLVVLEEADGWYRVQLPAQGTGWIAGWLVGKPEVLAESPQPGTWVAVVTANNVNIRNGPDTTSPVIARVNAGESYEIAGEEGQWYKIRLGTQEGWIAAWLVAVRVGNLASRGEDLPPSGPDGDSGAGVVINDVTAQPTGSGVEIRVAASAPPSFKVLSLTGPPRLVFDLPGAVLGDQFASTQLEMAGNGLVNGVRVSQYEPDTVRIVADLSGEASWHSSREGNAITFAVGLPSLAGQVVVLDPGHGVRKGGDWSDPGAIGPTGLLEREIAMDISRRTGAILVDNGATVIFTRTGDTALSLEERAQMANQAAAQVFVSIHLNASPNPGLQGTSTYFYAAGSEQRTERQRLAAAIQSNLVSSLGRPDLGVREANFAVLRYSQMPAVLVEVAFISNPDEEQLLAREDFRQQAAAGIAKGIMTYLGSS